MAGVLAQDDLLAHEILSRYGFHPDGIARIRGGFGTTNWKVESKGLKYFAKVYGDDSDLQNEEKALQLGQFARRNGILTPKVEETLGHRLISDGKLKFSLFEYIDGSPRKRVDRIQSHKCGFVLGSLHRLLGGYETDLASQTEDWLAFDLNRKILEIDRFCDLISLKAAKSEFDLLSLDLLKRKKVLARDVPLLMGKVKEGTTQVIHNDYSFLNLLFYESGDFASVIDFSPPSPFLVPYELGRIALDCDTLERPDWLDIATQCVEGYCEAAKPKRADVALAPSAWLVQLIRSTYGLKSHYSDPHEFQGELDTFWLKRARVSDFLHSKLKEIEEEFSRCWERHSD
jgi:Ser/Thr protein kinase RdoA (MazF antagonist)